MAKPLKVNQAKIANVVAYGAVPYDQVLKGLGVALDEFGNQFGERRFHNVTETDKTDGSFHSVRFRFFFKKATPDEGSTDIVVVVTENADGTFEYTLQPQN